MQKFTRADLQNHKFEMIRKRASTLVMQHHQPILRSAECGETSYFLTFNNKMGHVCINTQQPPELTIDNYIEAFRSQYPGCTVEYVEIWVDIPATKYDAQTKILKKGIRIDWS